MSAQCSETVPAAEEEGVTEDLRSAHYVHDVQREISRSEEHVLHADLMTVLMTGDL